MGGGCYQIGEIFLVSAVYRLYCFSLVKDPSWMMTTVLRRTNNDDVMLVFSLGWFISTIVQITRAYEEGEKEGMEVESTMRREEGVKWLIKR